MGRKHVGFSLKRRGYPGRRARGFVLGGVVVRGPGRPYVMMIAGFYRVMVVPQADCAHSRGEQSVGMYRVEKQRESF